MTSRDYETYRNLYQAVSAFLPPPSLIVYLRASIDTLADRIQQRGRDFEQDISRDYLTQLHDLYEGWIGNWTACPVLKIETDEMDFQHNESDYQHLLQNIRTAIVPIA